MIGITLDRERIAAGEFLTGNIQWAGEAGRVARIIVAAAWRTDGVGNVASGFGRTAVFELDSGQSDAVIPFRLLIPYEGPVSFQGELIAVDWKLRVRVDQRGFDEWVESSFWVTPRR